MQYSIWQINEQTITFISHQAVLMRLIITFICISYGSHGVVLKLIITIQK